MDVSYLLENFDLIKTFGVPFIFQDALAPRAARNIKSYAEALPPERINKRKKKGADPQERLPKRRRADSGYSHPVIEGATAQVRGWSYGNLPKRDATRFFREVKLITFDTLFLMPKWRKCKLLS